MKTLKFLAIAILFCLISCKAQEEKKAIIPIQFGIHKIATIGEIPEQIVDTLKKLPFQFENQPQIVPLGYIKILDSLVLTLDLSKDSLMLVKSVSPVDKNKIYYAVYAIKTIPAITNIDIKKTKANGESVDISFNLAGARKWAAFTKENTGKSVAFLINNLVYMAPLVNSEIKSGMAQLNRIENDSIAKAISESLNSNLSH